MKQSDLDYFNQVAEEHPIDKDATLDDIAPQDTPSIAVPIQNKFVPTKEDIDFFKNVALKEKPYYDGGDTLSKASDVLSDFPINLAQGAISVAKLPNEVASYLSRNADADNGDLEMVGQSIHTGSGEALQKLNDLQSALELSKSSYGRSSGQNQPIFTPAKNKNDIVPFDINAPSASQLSSFAGNLLPSIGLFEGAGKALPAAAEAVGGGKLAQTVAQGTGYGLANTALSAPSSYQVTYEQAYKQNIDKGMPPEEADNQAKDAAEKVMNIVAPLSFGAGALGGAGAANVAGNVGTRFIKGAALGALPMAAQMGIQSAAESNALGHPPDPYDIANNVALGALMGGVPGGIIGALHGKAKINSTAPVYETPEGARPDQAFNPATGKIEDIPAPLEEKMPQSPISQESLSPATDIDTAAQALDATQNGNDQNINQDVLKDLVDTGHITQDDAGNFQLTDLGNKLSDELNKLKENDNQQSILQKSSVSTVPDIQNEIQPVETATRTTQPEMSPVIKTKNPLESHLLSLEKEHDALPSDSPLRQNIAAEMNQIVERMPEVQQARAEGLMKNPEIGPVPIESDIATPEEERAIADYQNTKQSDIPFSVTPADEFSTKQPIIKDKLNKIIQRINPDVKTEFTDKLFGEGEAAKESGAETAEPQEVAGSFDRAKNLITASLNTDKWNPTDTAYHEAYHSVRDMVKPADDEILKQAFPGTDKLSQPEHEAIEFGRFMTEKNAAGFIPKVKRVFSSIRQTLRDIGRTFKAGNFNSVEDIFNRTERGDIYNDYQRALKDGDVESLRNSQLSAKSKQQAIKESSPALHDIVYSTTPKDDAETFKNMNLEKNGTPEQKAYALGNDIGRMGEAVNKGLDTTEAVKEKMLRNGLELVKPFIGDKTYNDARRRVEASITKTKRSGGGLNIARTTRDVAQIVISSNDGHIGAIADRTKSPTVVKIRDYFHPAPGQAKSLGRTYHEEIAYFTNRILSQVAKQLHDIHEPSDKEAIRDYMVHPEKITAEAIKNNKNAAIAGQLARTVQDMVDHLKANGYEVPQIEGFYPRIYDNNNIVGNEAAFKEDARKAYYDTYKEDYNNYETDADVRIDLNNKVNAWYNNILLQDDGITNDPNGYFRNVSTVPDGPSSFKQRVLSKGADDILAKWMVRDPLSAMNKLTIQTGRKAAWEKFFGGDKLRALHQGMIDDGLNGNDISHVMNIIRSNTGQLGGDIHRSIKNALALSRYWTAVRFLTKAPFKHLSISVNSGVHTGNPINAWRTFVDSAKALYGADSIQATKTFAELAGITGESAEHAMLLNQNGTMSDNEKINFMSSAYYDAVGMTKLIGAHKIGMQRSIQYMLSDMADDIINRKNGFKSAEFMAKNYGVPENEVGNFAEWIKGSGGKDIDTSTLLGDSPYADMYRLASQRATDQIISNPTGATRQMYASHPVGSLMYQFSAYHMTAMKNSLQRNARLFGEGLKTGNDYDMRDRLRFIAPMALYLPAMTLFMYGYNKAKDAIWPTDYKDKTNEVAKAVVNADLFAQFNGLAEDIIGSKYLQKNLGYYYHDWDAHKSIAERTYDKLGPDFSMFKDYGKMFYNIADNMSNNKTKKSNEIKAEYNNIVAPIVTSVVATYVPFAIPAFAGIQAINHPKVRKLLTNVK